MKTFNFLISFLVFFLLFPGIGAFSQVGISTDGSAPDNSAGLEVKFTNKGFLPPRMTRTQLNSIVSPADGLVVYCTDCGSNGLGALCIFSTGAWYTTGTDCENPISPVAGIHNASVAQIVWTWNPVSYATGYKWNVTNNYATAMDMGVNLLKTETGLICNTAYSRYVWAYNDCGFSPVIILNQSTLACPFTCGNSIVVNHTVGATAPVTKTVTYATVTNIPGETLKCWITSNLGASIQATAVDDTSEASAGWGWQFNRKQGYMHTGVIRTPNTIWISIISENSGWTAANDPCALELGTGWRIPTSAEWGNVNFSGSWINWNGPWNSGLKLHAAGYMYALDGSLYDRGSFGYYWSNTQEDNGNGRGLGFNSSYIVPMSDSKAYGFSIRCIKE